MSAYPVPEGLIERLRPDMPRTLPQRERIVELASACAFLAALVLFTAKVPPDDLALLPASAFALAYAIASRIPIWCGAGSTVPTQPVFVAALFALPPATVPVIVVLALTAGALVDVARRREATERIACAVGDSWFALAPAVVFAAAGAPAAELSALPVLAAALAAQFTGDVAVSLARERLGRSVAARKLLPVLVVICAADLALAPIGFMAAVTTDGTAGALLLIAPVIAFLALLTRDRNARLIEAADRVAALRRERARAIEASRRLGRAFGTTLSGEGLVELARASAADALDCGPENVMLVLDDATPEPARGPELLREAVKRAPVSGGCAELETDGFYALSHVLGGRAGERTGALGVMRHGQPFDDSERELIAVLASQVAIALENVSLHDLVRRQAATDELTGLANLRSLRERLAREIGRAHRYGFELSFVLIDLDHFKRVNDTFGHLEGDRVLAAVADVVARAARGVDLVARYGGEELAVLMPGTDATGATAAAERMRRKVESLTVRLAGGGTATVTASFGVASVPGAEADPRRLLAAADEALYEAKRGGRNRVTLAPAGGSASVPS